MNEPVTLNECLKLSTSTFQPISHNRVYHIWMYQNQSLEMNFKVNIHCITQPTQLVQWINRAEEMMSVKFEAIFVLMRFRHVINTGNRHLDHESKLWWWSSNSKQTMSQHHPNRFKSLMDPKFKTISTWTATCMLDLSFFRNRTPEARPSRGHLPAVINNRTSTMRSQKLRHGLESVKETLMVAARVLWRRRMRTEANEVVQTQLQEWLETMARAVLDELELKDTKKSVLSMESKSKPEKVWGLSLSNRMTRSRGKESLLKMISLPSMICFWRFDRPPSLSLSSANNCF